MNKVPLLKSRETLQAVCLSSESRPLSRILGSLRARVSARFGYALGDQVVYSFGNMVVAAIVSRHCAQQQFGLYILTQRTLDILIQVSNVVLWAPFTFNLPGTCEQNKARYQGSVFSLQVLLCLLFTLAIWLVSRSVGAAHYAGVSGTFFPLVASSGGILFREFTRRMYFASMRFKEAFWTDAATVALQIFATLWLWKNERLDLFHVLAGLCAGSVLVSLWWLIREWSAFHVEVDATWRDLRRNLEMGRWFLGSNMVFLAGSQCNPWVLGSVLGGSAVGAYAVCESVVNIPRVAFTSMQNVMGPMLARAQLQGGKTGVRAAVQRMDRVLLLASLSACLGIFGLGPIISRLIFRVPVPNARVILLVLGLNLVAYTSTLAQSYGLTALGCIDKTFYANALGLAVQAGACMFLIRRFQVSGAAAAMLVGSCVVLIARQMFFARAVQTDIPIPVGEAWAGHA